MVFFDGKEVIDYEYELKEITPKELGFSLVRQIEKHTCVSPLVHVYQAMPNKLSKLEYIIQKGVEVGVDSFSFFRSERSQKLVVSNNKLERLKKIMIEALEQSGGNIVPDLQMSDDIAYPGS